MKKSIYSFFLSFSLLASLGLHCCVWGDSLVVVHGLSYPVACRMWDQTHIPCIGRQILNHWTTREVPGIVDKDSVNTCEMWQKAVLPFYLGHSVFDAGCFMKKLGLSQVTWC